MICPPGSYNILKTFIRTGYNTFDVAISSPMMRLDDRIYDIPDIQKERIAVTRMTVSLRIFRIYEDYSSVCR